MQYLYLTEHVVYIDTVSFWREWVSVVWFTMSVCHVFACVSAPWGSAAVISGDGVRGQRSCAVESSHWHTGLPSCLGTIHWSDHTSNTSTSFPLRFPANLFTHVCFSVYKGRNVETVEVAGDSQFHTLSGLQPDTEYILTIIPLYEGNTEGPVATARFKIGRSNSSHLPQHQKWISAVCNSFYCCVLLCF